MVADAVSACFGGVQELAYFALVQEILPPFVAVGGSGGCTFDISPVGHGLCPILNALGSLNLATDHLTEGTFCQKLATHRRLGVDDGLFAK